MVSSRGLLCRPERKFGIVRCYLLASLPAKFRYDQGSNEDAPKVWTFDPSTTIWKPAQCVGSIPPACDSSVVTVLDDVMFMFGGESKKVLYAFDPEGMWSFTDSRY